METMKLKVKGMHCKACEMLIRDILEEEDIEVISVSQNTGILEFNYDDKKHDLKKIKKELLENNYKVVE